MSPEAQEPSTRRTLAAIVFTDVVDFSAMMQANEDQTMRLVKRDLDLFGSLCTKHHGRVLKGTGDGLLMYFDSAVQAVACALEAQEAARNHARTLPREQVLQHRIGIHLGDVFVTETDVMGDGVNIAARLQTQAEPGGVCISQTVYDVVKNRLAVQATFLGARELKNIREAIPVYQILLEAQGGAAPRRPVRKKSQIGPWHWVMIGTAAAVVALAAVLTIVVLRPQAQRGESGPAPERPSAKAADTRPGAASRPLFAGEKLAAMIENRDPQVARIDSQRRSHLAKLDFAGMGRWLAENAPGTTELRSRYTKLDAARKVMLTRITMASETEPLTFSDKSGAKVEVWGSALDLNIRTGASTRQQRLDQASPALIVQLMRAAGQSDAAAVLQQEFTDAGMMSD
jgi:class 3 adenylate cyclase